MDQTLQDYIESQVQEKMEVAIAVIQIIKMQQVQIRKILKNLKRRITIIWIQKMNLIHLKFKVQVFNKNYKIMIKQIIKISLIQEF